jgi:hypothetical protein
MHHRAPCVCEWGQALNRQVHCYTRHAAACRGVERHTVWKHEADEAHPPPSLHDALIPSTIDDATMYAIHVHMFSTIGRHRIMLMWGGSLAPSMNVITECVVFVTDVEAA